MYDAWESYQGIDRNKIKSSTSHDYICITIVFNTLKQKTSPQRCFLFVLYYMAVILLIKEFFVL